MSDKVLSSKDPRETIPVTFRAENLPVFIISSATITVSVLSGIDTSSSAMLSGSPVIRGTEVQQMITGGVAGVTYNITANIFSGAANYIISATLPVIVNV